MMVPLATSAGTAHYLSYTSCSVSHSTRRNSSGLGYISLDLHAPPTSCDAAWVTELHVPLVAIGLSPTLLYLNSLQTSYGIDLPYAAICLWLLLSVRPDSRAALELGKIFLCSPGDTGAAPQDRICLDSTA